MKSEQRHQLQENELANALGGYLTQFAPYARAILFGIIGLVAIVIAINFRSTSNHAYESNASLDFLLATRDEDPESFNVVNNEYADTQAGQWARQAQADLNLSQGIEALYIDRDEAAGFIQAAVDSYQDIAKSATDPLLKSRAHYGLAKALESQGELEQAIDEYTYVAENTDSKVLKQRAEDRVEALGRDDVRNFYSWFKENQPIAMASDPPTLPGIGDIPDSPIRGLPPVESPVDEDSAPEPETTSEETETESK